MARGKKSGGMIGSKVSIPADRAFGTPEEIHGRDHEAHQNSPTSFKQIGPADNAGMNLATADKSAGSRSGSMKFSKGIPG